MGHGDEIVLADSNFPAASCCTEGPKLIDASGLDIPELLEAILKFFPLDTYVFNPVVLMDLVNSDKKKDMEVRVSVQGVESLWGDCRFIPADWWSW